MTLAVMTLADYVRIAIRYDTMMADAMLRACGIVRVRSGGAPISSAAYLSEQTPGGEVRECFENRSRAQTWRML